MAVCQVFNEDGSGGLPCALICDDYAGYKQVMNVGSTETGDLNKRIKALDAELDAKALVHYPTPIAR